MKKTILFIYVISMMVCIASPIRSNLASRNIFVQEEKSHEYIPASEYIQYGLISMLDGIENGGVGIHDQDSHIWTNLKDTGTSPGNSSMTFGDDYMKLSTSIYALALSTEELAALSPKCDYTVEFLVETGDTTWNDPFFLYGGNPRSKLVYFYPVPKRVWYYRSLISNGPGTMSIGETCLFTFVREGTKGYVYVNGELVAVKDIDNTQDVYSMYFFATAHKQKRIAIYNRPLTQKEISYNYSIDKSRFNL